LSYCRRRDDNIPRQTVNTCPWLQTRCQGSAFCHLVRQEKVRDKRRGRQPRMRKKEGRRKDVARHTHTQHSIGLNETSSFIEKQKCVGTHRIATKLYASGKAGAGADGAEGVANKASGMTMTSGGRAWRDAGAFGRGVLGGATHHGVGKSSVISGLASKVLASSEAGSCTARVKRARSSGVNAAHISSVDARPKIRLLW
jgi:hypothetical protein